MKSHSHTSRRVKKKKKNYVEPRQLAIQTTMS